MVVTADDLGLYLKDEQDTEKLGQILAGVVSESGQGLVVFLEGELGMGKTTLSRGVMHGLGHQGAVKSPTYTIVEPYEHLNPPAYHFDLYRLGDPEELEYMGIRDYFQGQNLCVVEWPGRGLGILPEPDLLVRLEKSGDGRSARVSAPTSRGCSLLARIAMQWPTGRDINRV
ncbi:tRNA (adenosine(37)-N6)-threonylcarbamoyltransferase complex ATPase subunit type 1 TsaE [Marinobacter orientalis]|uniref:tRNA threonylcarbamoyladenosine biosynthesis protein TsaE n=1 Tax=Marinobacter orientalis TaxID=1928859 RepID=A0A7Y0RFV9_9GAMM|nr:tRNA (adenosine(37)-N6)-threonylcarbamoyltransferase complex ATPase subunit type 1 TsaE [Marinobacter orientalis]NMT65458.1 tRNA (adenosine(37)-N6)-threonylcarbamoyltransferase complex ATPase subunit type 1 TsaE [Marinobacter orientalis]TGX47362.1 tRNA (adenosine(37)-N6)-threonylcarbamoyltransferase complex ATPase subunit type 1 TsaE [Marinobacter orientalis]